MKKRPDTSAASSRKSPSLETMIQRLRPLIEKIRSSPSSRERHAILDSWPTVRDFLQSSHPLVAILPEISFNSALIIKTLVAIEQLDRLLPALEQPKMQCLQVLIDQLTGVEKFYHEIGGLIGYHWMMLQFLAGHHPNLSASEAETTYSPVEGTDITEENLQVREMILWGLHYLPQMAEIYPLGGAADRLGLQDEKTGTPLPAAKLPFLGKTLLEHLIQDLEAREYIYFQLFGKLPCTPIAIMTSTEKDNQAHILAICEEKKWFERPKESIRLFCQPLVPTLNADGKWCIVGHLQPLLKPGGHGVIWKLARDEGVFAWLKSEKRTKALVRQINNPLAGTDYGLLAFAGLGFHKDKLFGFASCYRHVKASEGVNVLSAKKREDGTEYAFTNIEYCDFKKYGIVDEPMAKDSSYSKFTSNTNILFTDLSAVEEASLSSSMPGLLINLKKTRYRNEDGQIREEALARLESTMQNIADCFSKTLENPLEPNQYGDLPTFITFNVRRKTISTTKREFTLGTTLLETPEGCFLDLLHNAYELLSLHCGIQISPVNAPLDFFIKGPPFIFLYHPALGPLYSIIAQKIRGGRMEYGAELQTEIAELDMLDIDLEGSLIIRADNVLGKSVDDNTLSFGDHTGRCTLHRVIIRNAGVDREASNVYWRNTIFRKESCEIILHGMAEFEAYDVVLPGDLLIEVQDGCRLIARQGENGGILFEEEKIVAPTWKWVYTIDDKKRICLHKHSI